MDLDNPVVIAWAFRTNEHSTLVLRKLRLSGRQRVLDYPRRTLRQGRWACTWHMVPANLKASSFRTIDIRPRGLYLQQPSREQVHIFMPHGVHALIVVDEKRYAAMNMLASVIR
jgi:hypothetical protein